MLFLIKDKNDKLPYDVINAFCPVYEPLRCPFRDKFVSGCKVICDCGITKRSLYPLMDCYPVVFVIDFYLACTVKKLNLPPYKIKRYAVIMFILTQINMPIEHYCCTVSYTHI